MAEKVVSVRLQARVEGFTAGMRKARASVDDLTKAAAPNKAKSFESLANKAALAGVAIAAGIGVAVKRFADFDEAMSAVAANSGAAGAELESLRAVAIKLGADSQFSATEAAQGINEMAKAGVKTADILGGGLKGALDLAAAGQISVADASETAATAMTQFKLSGDKVPHIADLLANAANKAQGGVGDMAAALKQAGLVAASTGLSIEETTAGLTAFASAGLIGSDAGTSFKTMLQRLSAPTDVAASEMQRLGISAYDSQGNFVGLANVAENLKTSMQNLTPEQRNASMAIIFGADAVRASNILYNEGAAGINKWTKEVSEQGAAARQAAALTDNLKGDIERLGGALDSVFIQTGGSANSALRTLVQGAQGLVEQVGKIPGPVLLAGAGLASLALVVPKGVSMFRNYTAQLDTLGLSFEKISARGPRAAKGINLTTKAAKGLGIVAAALVAGGALDKIFGPDGGRPGAQGLTKDLIEAEDAVGVFSQRMKEFADEQSNWWSSVQVTNYGDALHDVFDPSVAQNIDNAAGSLLEMFGAGNNSDIASATAALKDLDGVLTGLVSNGAPSDAAALFDQFAAAAQRQGISVDQLKTKLPGYTEALAGAANQSALTGGASSGLTGNIEDVTVSAEDAKDALDKYVQGLQNAGLVVLGTREANRGFQAAIDDVTDSIKQNGKTLDINSAKGRANQGALDGVASSALDLAQAIYDETGSEESMRRSLVKSRASLVETYKKFDNNEKRANAYADSILKIPAARSTKVSISVSGIAALKQAQDYLYGIRNKRVTLTVGTVRVGGGRVNAGQFADGGYTGDGAKYEPAGIVHKGEYVFSKAATQSIGKATLDALHKQSRMPGYADGGFVKPTMTRAVSPQLTSRRPSVGGISAPSFTVDYDLLADAVASRPILLDGEPIYRNTMSRAGRVLVGGRTNVGLE